MSDFKEFLSTLADRVGALALGTLKDFKDAATKDGKAFLEKARQDLERWTGLLETGQLTKEEFEFPVKGKKDLAELAALKQAGLAKARLDKFRTSLVELVIGTAVEKFL